MSRGGSNAKNVKVRRKLILILKSKWKRVIFFAAFRRKFQNMHHTHLAFLQLWAETLNWVQNTSLLTYS